MVLRKQPHSPTDIGKQRHDGNKGVLLCSTLADNKTENPSRHLKRREESRE